jgi:hypothetical protein
MVLDYGISLNDRAVMPTNLIKSYGNVYTVVELWDSLIFIYYFCHLICRPMLQ